MKHQKLCMALGSLIALGVGASEALAVPLLYPPWECGKSHKIVCGNSDTHGGCLHSVNDAANHYAWDVDMNYETLLAPVDGEIVMFAEDTEGQTGNSYDNNYVVMKIDGSNLVLKFAHLKYKSVTNAIKNWDTAPTKSPDFSTPNQYKYHRYYARKKVKRGDPIGVTGETGLASGPHLHFAAFNTYADGMEPNASQPIQWVDSSGNAYTPSTAHGSIMSQNCSCSAASQAGYQCSSTSQACLDTVAYTPANEGKGTVCEAYPVMDQYYMASRYDRHSTDVDGDGKADICIRTDSGIECMLSTKGDMTKYEKFITNTDGNTNGWNEQYNYNTLRFPDINGDGKADVCMRLNDGLNCWITDKDNAKPGSHFVLAAAAPSNAKGGRDELKDTRFFSTFRFADVNGDGKDDFCLRYPTMTNYVGGLYCYISNGQKLDYWVQGPEWSDEKGWDDALYYSTIRFADINGDGNDDVCILGDKEYRCHLSNGARTAKGVAFDENKKVVVTSKWGALLSAGNTQHTQYNWGNYWYNLTIHSADINGDGKADFCARSATGIECALSEGDKFSALINGPAWGDSNAKDGWDYYFHAITIQFGDLNGDGMDDICGRGVDGLECHLSTGKGFESTAIRVPNVGGTDTEWHRSSINRTMNMADVDGDGRMDVCVRGLDGISCYLFKGDKFEKVAGPAWITDSDSKLDWSPIRYYSTIRIGGPYGNPCSKRTEICGDGIDNNCNGKIDEGCVKPDECVPTEEICDGKDNDCDGVVDNGDVCKTDPVCVPTEEICDGKDNDCDGVIDNGDVCKTDPVCVPTEEICDGKDNDCDGVVDNGDVCKPEAGCEPSDEICDGKDNDCDGVVDNGDVCKPEPGCEPSDEICDGKDNDCDGVVDNGDVCEEAILSADDCSCAITRKPASPTWPIAILGLLGLAGGLALRRRRQ